VQQNVNFVALRYSFAGAEKCSENPQVYIQVLSRVLTEFRTI